MDVRAIDTTSIAAKRIELEKTRPVNKKAHTFMDDRQVTHQIDSDSEEQELNQQAEDDSVAEEEHFDAEDNGSVSATDLLHGEHHELDVRV